MRTFECRKHGLLTNENSYRTIEKGQLRLRCKECRNVSAMVLRANGKARICKKHGELKPEDIISRGRCGLCNREKGLERDLEKRRIYEKNLYHKNIEDQRIRGMIKNKNITRDQYYDLLQAQDNKCNICGLPESRFMKGTREVARLAIDHCHRTGKIRSLLCHACNVSIGLMKDSPELLRKAADYVEHHNTC